MGGLWQEIPFFAGEGSSVGNIGAVGSASGNSISNYIAGFIGNANGSGSGNYTGSSLADSTGESSGFSQAHAVSLVIPVGGFELDGQASIRVRLTCIPEGSLNLRFKTQYSFTINVITLFDAGEVAYIKASAQKGELETIFIKKVNIIDQYKWNYQDKENRIWIERELCTFEQANQIIDNRIDYGEPKGYIAFIPCATYSYTINVTTLFQKEEVVYIKAAARKGKLETIFIKKINILDEYRWNYQDKNNRIWIEDELCTLEQANQLIQVYINNLGISYLNS